MPFLYRVAYDGALFHGFTGHQNSVELALRRAIGEILGRGSRTDPGVSAVANVVMASRVLPAGYINSRLPRGVWVWAVASVPDGFNPRRARAREYLYVAPHWGEDLEDMREAAGLLTGTHNYASFAKTRGSGGVPAVTTTYRIDVELAGSLVVMRFVGRGFRNKMLRKLAWAILAAGRGVLRLRDLKELLENPRPGAVPSAPAEGLVLLNIEYDGVSFQVDAAALRSVYRYFLSKARSLAARAAALETAGKALALWED
jgi:tRNA pseudouridine38-40 synthase